MLDIFTDRSTIEGHVRAAAVALRFKEERVCYIDTEAVTTVFRAEIQSITITTSMAMTIKETQNKNI